MIYALTADAAHIEEEDVFDAVLLEFENFEDVSFFRPEIDYRRRYGAPAVMEFVGNLENVAWLDHIFTAPMGFLLISKRMVRVLESVGPFRHRLIQAVIYSSEVEHLVYDKRSRRRTWYQVREPALRNDDFVILQLQDQLDCMDREHTLVECVPFSRCGEQYLGMEEAQHLELHEPAGGFPPVFFVPELLYYCFTEEAKQACDKAGLKGLWWRPQP